MRIFPDMVESRPKRDGAGNLYYNLPKEVAVAAVQSTRNYHGNEIRTPHKEVDLNVQSYDAFHKLILNMAIAESVDVSDDPPFECSYCGGWFSNESRKDRHETTCSHNLGRETIPPFMNFAGLELVGYKHKVDDYFMAVDEYTMKTSRGIIRPSNYRAIYCYKEGYGE